MNAKGFLNYKNVLLHDKKFSLKEVIELLEEYGARKMCEDVDYEPPIPMGNNWKMFEQWVNSERGKVAADGRSIKLPPEHNEFLRNRLFHAYCAGFNARDITE